MGKTKEENDDIIVECPLCFNWHGTFEENCPHCKEKKEEDA